MQRLLNFSPSILAHDMKAREAAKSREAQP
jgi:hypothetical protein